MRSPLKKGEFGYRCEYKENTPLRMKVAIRVMPLRPKRDGKDFNITRKRGMAASGTHHSDPFSTSGTQNYDTIMSVV